VVSIYSWRVALQQSSLTLRYRQCQYLNYFLYFQPVQFKGSLQNVFDKFKKVWGEMQFQNFNSNPQSKDFKTWLIRIPLEGNYRTPQSIAINWHQGRLIFGAENESDIFDFVRNQFPKFHSSNSTFSNATLFNFRKGVSMKKMECEYEIAMLEWAFPEDGYGANEKAVQCGLNNKVRLRKRLAELKEKLRNIA
jgi:hypothetical protein